MKTVLVLAAAALMLLTSALAAEKQSEAVSPTVVKNLLHNLKSENKGVHESSAYMLGEMKCREAVIPLLAMLHSDAEESSRIVAALSLSRIGDGRGTFAVKQAVRFDESPRVRALCAWFTNQYTSPQPFEFGTADEAAAEAIAER